MRILAATLVVLACALPACKKQRRGEPLAQARRPAPTAPTATTATSLALPRPTPPGAAIVVGISPTALLVADKSFPMRPDGSDDLEGFTAALAGLRGNTDAVTLNTDASVTHGRVVSVMATLNEHGFTRIAFAVRR
ncbi:MAG: hypothetical protein IT370_06850 [Deltaproteobacteria bacterium]|nr:hypothetical protein [Deltaproteobacteria bacterium]